MMTPQGLPLLPCLNCFMGKESHGENCTHDAIVQMNGSERWTSCKTDIKWNSGRDMGWDMYNNFIMRKVYKARNFRQLGTVLHILVGIDCCQDLKSGSVESTWAHPERVSWLECTRGALDC